jgi:hypothetical protein
MYNQPQLSTTISHGGFVLGLILTAAIIYFAMVRPKHVIEYWLGWLIVGCVVFIGFTLHYHAKWTDWHRKYDSRSEDTWRWIDQNGDGRYDFRVDEGKDPDTTDKDK